MPDAYYETARTQFEAETSEHEITILHDDGVYRHIRCAKPGTGMWSWNIVTWPGHLAVSGDVGDGYQFARLTDMFDFFNWQPEPFRINPQYWAEKMPHVIARQSYSESQFKTVVAQHANDWREQLTPSERVSFTAQLEREVLANAWNEYDAVEALNDFRFNGRGFVDTWDWGAFADWDHHFLIACFCICWGIEKYKEAKDA